MPVSPLFAFLVSQRPRILYRHHLHTGNAAHALGDQEVAGAITSVGSMVVRLVALSACLLRWIDEDQRRTRRAEHHPSGRISSTLADIGASAGGA
jgi:cytochrome c oxidase assembly factor CtaG